MNSSTKDKIKGRIHEAKGKVKEEAGKRVGNPDLPDRGTAEKVAGRVQNKVGDVKKVFGKQRLDEKEGSGSLVAIVV